jgi:hypothetical protein
MVSGEGIAMGTITVPPLVGSRNQARKLLTNLPELYRGGLIIECGQMSLGTPSFIDEIVKIVLIERECEWLRLVDPPQTTLSFAIESAESLGVRERLQIEQH